MIFLFQVIARIFFVVNRSWSGLITLSELRKSNLLATIRILEEEEDINQITDFFSYEHFYVIYCKFWELDKDHDLFIDREDLSRHNDHGKQDCRRRLHFYSTNIIYLKRSCNIRQLCSDDAGVVFFSHQTILGHKHVQTKKKNIVQQSGTLTQKSSNIQVQFGNRKKTIISSSSTGCHSTR